MRIGTRNPDPVTHISKLTRNDLPLQLLTEDGMRLDRIRWLLLDLDNTILDYDAGAQSALIRTFNHFGILATEENIELYKTINRNYWGAFENGEIDIQTLKRKRFESLVASMDLGTNPQEMNVYYLDQLSSQAQVISGASDLLTWAKTRFKLAIVTNGFPEVQRPRIEKAGLNTYFEKVFISEEIGLSKPQITFFQFLYDQIQPASKDEIMIIGDNLSSDIKGGLDFGINTCWFNPAQVQNDSNIKPHFEITSYDQLISQWP